MAKSRLMLLLTLLVILSYLSFQGVPSNVLEKEITTITLRVFLEVPEEAEHLTFLVRVRNLTSEGIKPIAEVKVVPLMQLDGVKFNIKVWKVFRGYIDIKEKDKWIKIPVFYSHSIWVYAIAYDPIAKKLYYGSWTKGLDPYHNKTTDLTIKVKEYRSREVLASKVPDIGQSKSWVVDRCIEAKILAISIPAGVYYDYAIKPGTEVSVRSYERLYWTDSYNPRDPDTIWYDEGWEPAGTSPITLDVGLGEIDDGIYVHGPASIYYYPLNVKFVMATEGVIYSSSQPDQISWVIVKLYAQDTGGNGVGSESWSSPSYKGIPSGSLLRPERLCSAKSFTNVYFSIVGSKTVQVGFSGNVTFTKVTMVIAKIYVDWSRVPLNINKFEVDRYDSGASILKGWFIEG